MICGYKFNIRHIIKHLFCNALKPYVVGQGGSISYTVKPGHVVTLLSSYLY